MTVVDPKEVDAKIKWLREERAPADPLGKAIEILADLEGTQHLENTCALWRAVVQKLQF